jgi:sporadic carbohydrate cluster protein (TIGR04323 family)
MSERLGFRGYVSSRPFGGFCIPVPVQSLVLRDYCQRNGLVYVLPVNENVFPHSYLVLEGMIRDLGSYQGIVACSIHMMPQTAERRRVIFDTILSQWSAIHFCIEDIVVSDDPGVAKLEGIFSLLDCVRPVPDQLLLDQ